jgi:hypothetical protein
MSNDSITLSKETVKEIRKLLTEMISTIDRILRGEKNES